MKTSRSILAKKPFGRLLLTLVPLLFIAYLFARSNTYDATQIRPIVSPTDQPSTQENPTTTTTSDSQSETTTKLEDETQTLTSQLLMKAGIDTNLTPTVNKNEWMGGAILQTREPPPVAIPRPFGKNQDDDLDEALLELSRCTNMRCIIRSHDKIDGRTRFNLPHFFMIGWQKSATLDVNNYLRHHPEYMAGIDSREPHWFTNCQPDQDFSNCHANNETQYFRDYLSVREAAATHLEVATADISSDYAQQGAPLARRLFRYFPWLKIVIMMREPISRLISETRVVGNATTWDGTGCSPWSTLFYCLMPHLTPGHVNSNYSEPLEGWLTTFPSSQIHIIQYEELEHTPEKVLYDLKVFIGLDPDDPKEDYIDTLTPTDQDQDNINNDTNNDNNTNTTTDTNTTTAGVQIRKGQYQRLVRMVREDAEQVAGLLDRYGLADRAGWMSRWEQVWQGNLQTCDGDDNCMAS